MNNKLIEFNLNQRSNKDLLKLRAGDVVRVHRKIKEGEKERIQIFEGMIIAIKGKQSSSPMITVRKISNGVGVEIVVPVFSPVITEIEIIKRAKVRRSKLYYIRDKTVKSLRLKYKDMADFFKKDEEIDTEKDASKDKEKTKDDGKKKEVTSDNDKGKIENKKEESEKNTEEKGDEVEVSENNNKKDADEKNGKEDKK